MGKSNIKIHIDKKGNAKIIKSNKKNKKGK